MKQEKFKAIVEEIKDLHTKGQPVLVGTISIEKSERLSKVLAREGIKHSVLNAKNHQLEAEIVSQAGQKGVVTISTNMAGRGTDIVLGEGVTAVGRPSYPGDGAPRIPAHRQSTARPVRTPGGPGQFPFLPFPGRRPAAHLRLRPHRRADGTRWAWTKVNPLNTT